MNWGDLDIALGFDNGVKAYETQYCLDRVEAQVEHHLETFFHCRYHHKARQFRLPLKKN